MPVRRPRLLAPLQSIPASLAPHPRSRLSPLRSPVAPRGNAQTAAKPDILRQTKSCAPIPIVQLISCQVLQRLLRSHNCDKLAPQQLDATQCLVALLKRVVPIPSISLYVLYLSKHMLTPQTSGSVLCSMAL
jgi:hypothetical protein